MVALGPRLVRNWAWPELPWVAWVWFELSEAEGGAGWCWASWSCEVRRGCGCARERKVGRHANCASGAVSKVAGGSMRWWLLSTSRCRSRWRRGEKGRKEGWGRWREKEKEERKEKGKKKKEKRKRKRKRKRKKKFVPSYLWFENIRINFASGFSYQNISRAKFARIFNRNKYGSNVNLWIKQKFKIVL